jgi:UDP-glucose 4-epimerase
VNRVLVTGGAGFIGSALCRHLAASVDKVVVLDDFSSGRAENLEGVDVEFQHGSILDESLVERLVSNVDVVFHLACKGVRHSIHDPVGNHEVNATGTLIMLEASLRSKVRRFVYTSTSEVYGTALQVPMPESHPTYPHTVYGGSKLAGEAYTRAYHRAYGLEAVVVRPFNAYGPRSHHEGDSGEVIPKFLVRAMNALPPIIFGDGSQTRDFTYVEDTAAGIALAAESEAVVGETVNLGSGSEVRIDDLADIILEAVGREQMEPVNTEVRPGDVHRLLADSSRAKEIMGWEPVVNLDEGIQKLLNWHVESGTDWEFALSQDRERNWEAAET